MLAIPEGAPTDLELAIGAEVEGAPVAFTSKAAGKGFKGAMIKKQTTLACGRAISGFHVSVTSANCPGAFASLVSASGHFRDRASAHAAVISLAAESIFGAFFERTSQSFNAGACNLNVLEICGEIFSYTQERTEAARHYYKFFSKFLTSNVQFAVMMLYLSKICRWDSTTLPPPLAIDELLGNTSAGGVSSVFQERLLAVSTVFATLSADPSRPVGAAIVLAQQHHLVVAALRAEADADARELAATTAAAAEATKRIKELQVARRAEVQAHQNNVYSARAKAAQQRNNSLIEHLRAEQQKR